MTCSKTLLGVFVLSLPLWLRVGPMTQDDTKLSNGLHIQLHPGAESPSRVSPGKNTRTQSYLLSARSRGGGLCRERNRANASLGGLTEAQNMG